MVELKVLLNVMMSSLAKVLDILHSKKILHQKFLTKPKQSELFASVIIAFVGKMDPNMIGREDRER